MVVGTAHSLSVPTTERGTAHSTSLTGYVLGKRAAPSWKGRRIARL